MLLGARWLTTHRVHAGERQRFARTIGNCGAPGENGPRGQDVRSDRQGALSALHPIWLSGDGPHGGRPGAKAFPIDAQARLCHGRDRDLPARRLHWHPPRRRLHIGTERTADRSEGAAARRHGSEPSYLAWKAELQREGVPFEAIAASTGHTPITAATLSDTLAGGVPRGEIPGRDPRDRRPGRVCEATCASALSSSEWSALESYEQTFNVRQISAYVYPARPTG